MAERKYYARCEKGCLFETMTKEQIISAIAQAMETGSIQDVDTGFITTVKELNSGAGLKFWFGTTAEYNALTEKDANCFYIKTDDTTATDTENAIKELREMIESSNTAWTQAVSKEYLSETFPKMVFGCYEGTGDVGDYTDEDGDEVPYYNVIQFDADFVPHIIFLFDMQDGSHPITCFTNDGPGEFLTYCGDTISYGGLCRGDIWEEEDDNGEITATIFEWFLYKKWTQNGNSITKEDFTSETTLNQRRMQMNMSGYHYSYFAIGYERGKETEYC